MSSDKPSELLTTGQVAALLGSSRQHVVDLCDRGVLPYVRIGSHRRVRYGDIQGLIERSLTRDQERALWLHRVVAARLVLDPDYVLAKAEANLDRLQEVHPTGMASRWLSAWRSLLTSGVDSVLDVLTSRSPYAVELRQNSPFAGILSDDERRTVLDRFRAHWRQEHAA